MWACFSSCSSMLHEIEYAESTLWRYNDCGCEDFGGHMYLQKRAAIRPPSPSQWGLPGLQFAASKQPVETLWGRTGDLWHDWHFVFLSHFVSSSLLQISWTPNILQQRWDKLLCSEGVRQWGAKKKYKLGHGVSELKKKLVNTVPWGEWRSKKWWKLCKWCPKTGEKMCHGVRVNWHVENRGRLLTQLACTSGLPCRARKPFVLALQCKHF